MGRASVDNLDALVRTLVFSFFVTVIQFGLGLFVAVIINQNLKGRNLFRTLYFMPVILGAVIQGMIWSLFLYPLGGPLAKFLELFGARSEFLGGQPTAAFAWVIVVQIWANMGTTMIIFLSGLQTISTEYYEAARIDATLAPLHEKLFVEANPIPVKWAVNRMGLIGETLRLPLVMCAQPASTSRTAGTSSRSAGCGSIPRSS